MRSVIPFLRSALFVAIMLAATVIWVIPCMLAAPLPYNKRYWVTARWNVFCIWLAKVLCGIDYQVKGMENLPDTPVIQVNEPSGIVRSTFLRLLPLAPFRNKFSPLPFLRSVAYAILIFPFR